MINDKKGGMGESLIAFYSYILLVLIGVMFFILFSVAPKFAIENKLTSSSENVDLGLQLRSLMDSPMILIEEKGLKELDNATVADYVLYAVHDKCFGETDPTKLSGTVCKQLKGTLEAQLMQLYGQTTRYWNKWHLSIKCGDKSMELGSSLTNEYVAQMNIPSYNENCVELGVDNGRGDIILRLTAFG